MKRGDVVMCEWDDACSHDDWVQPEADVRAFQALPSCTIGVLVARNKERVVIAGTVNNTGQYCMVMTIPTGMVTRLVKLHEK